jgi:hypothetical protein
LVRGTLFFEISILHLVFQKKTPEVDPRGPPVEGSKAVESVSRERAVQCVRKKIHQRDRLGEGKRGKPKKRKRSISNEDENGVRMDS